jgi:hypothetical protein
MFTPNWKRSQSETQRKVSAFDETFYNALIAAKKCAEAHATDKTTRGVFKAIESKVAAAQNDPRIELSTDEQSLIRRWYLKSLEY